MKCKCEVCGDQRTLGRECQVCAEYEAEQREEQWEQCWTIATSAGGVDLAELEIIAGEIDDMPW